MAAGGIMETGDIVCLVQSDTTDVRKAMSLNDVLPRCRETRSHKLVEGKISALSYIAADHSKGDVVKGELNADDTAKKGDVASLIVSSGKKSNRGTIQTSCPCLTENNLSCPFSFNAGKSSLSSTIFQL